MCPLLNDIKSRMKNLMGENVSQHVRFAWCPAHVGVRGNERADSEARDAATSGLQINNRVDYIQVTSHLKQEYKSLDAAFVSTLNSGAGVRYTKDFSHFNIRFFRVLDISRRDACRIVRMIAGYAYTGYYLFRSNARDNPNCDCGAGIQDLNHLFFECQLLSRSRSKLYDDLLKLEMVTPFSIKSVLYSINVKICKVLIKFIDDAKLKI